MGPCGRGECACRAMHHAPTHTMYVGTWVRTRESRLGRPGYLLPVLCTYDIPHLTNSAHALIPHSLYIYKLPVTTMALANLKFATPPSNSLFRLNPSTTYPYNPP